MGEGRAIDIKNWLDRINNPQEGDRELLHIQCTINYYKHWRKAFRAYLADPHDFAAADAFLYFHPANQRTRWGSPFSWSKENMDWYVVKVNPETNRIEGKGKHLTKTQVWVEWGPWCEPEDDPTHMPPDGISSHDPRTDTGGDTFEEAVVNLAHNVWKLYGIETTVPHDKELAEEDHW